MKKRVAFRHSVSLVCASLVLTSLSACDGNFPLNLPDDLAKLLAGPDAGSDSDVSPSNPFVRPASEVEAELRSGGSSASDPQSDKSSAQGRIDISGEEAFGPISVNYREGMKWVYQLKAPEVNVPGFPTGIVNPSGSGELGTMTQEVIAVEGDQVTLEVLIDVKAGSAVTDSRKRFSFSAGDHAALQSQAAFVGHGTGSITWARAGTERVSVPAGSYSAEKIKGDMNILAQENGVSVRIKNDMDIWMVSGIGMVKQTASQDNQGLVTTTETVLLSFER